jgi:hypothetical protein
MRLLNTKLILRYQSLIEVIIIEFLDFFYSMVIYWSGVAELKGNLIIFFAGMLFSPCMFDLCATLLVF